MRMFEAFEVGKTSVQENGLRLPLAEGALFTSGTVVVQEVSTGITTVTSQKESVEAVLDRVFPGLNLLIRWDTANQSKGWNAFLDWQAEHPDWTTEAWQEGGWAVGEAWSKQPRLRGADE